MASEIYQKMKELLLHIPSARIASGGREVVIRCMYCGDSKKNRSSAHLYIKLPIDNDIMVFNCVKCHTCGIVTAERIQEWCNNIDPQDLIDVSLYNKKVSSLSKNKKYLDKKVYRLSNDYVTKNKLSEIKLKYINGRLGLNLSYEDILSKKIILSLKDLLSSNGITQYTRYDNIMEELDRYFIGFISQDNAFVNLRNLWEDKISYESIRRRYINYNIFNKFNNLLKYYTLPTNVDLSRPEPLKIHMAEGAFDILSIYYNLRKEDINNVYTAILGSGYVNILKHFINGMGFINMEVHVYMDTDISNSVIYELRDICEVFMLPLYIHKNMYPNEKDFGVPISRINESIQRII